MKREKKKRYLLFQGAYDTLDFMMKQIEGNILAEGGEVLTFHLEHMEEDLKLLPAYMEQPVDAVLTMNNLGFTMETPGGGKLWEDLGIPCVNILMDHPFHYQSALEKAPENAIVYCIDQNHVDYVRRFFPNIRSVGFLPHAGAENAVFAEQNFQKAEDHLTIQERPIEVLYTGALAKYAVQGLIPDLSAIREFDAIDLSQSVLNELITHPQLTTEQAIEAYLSGQNLKFEDEKLREIIGKMRFLDSFATSYYRELSVRCLVEQGIDVTVYGFGWDQCEWAENPHLHYKGEIMPEQVIEVMNQAKITLNTMTWFKRGAHDRIFNGMLARSAVVTDASEYIREIFLDEKEMLIFELKDIMSLPDKVKNLLSNRSALQDIADCGYQAAKEKHQWKNRSQIWNA